MVLTLSLILASSVFSFAQGPIQVGWAVITPLSATTSGIVAFETFGFNRGAGSDTTQAGILPSGLTTNSVVFVSTSTRLSRNVGVAIVNPQNTTVNVSLTLRKDDGTQLATSVIVAIPPMQQTSKFITEMFPGNPADFLGTLTVTAPSPVGVIGLRFRGVNFSTIPVTNISPGGPVPSISANVGGAGAVLLPQFAAGGGWASQIVLVNTESTTLTARVDLFKADGTPLSTNLNGQVGSSFTNLTVPAGGVLTLSPANNSGDNDF